MIEGIIYNEATELPGRHRVIWHPTLDPQGRLTQDSEFQVLPGIETLSGASKYPAGIYIPHGVLRAGKRPAFLQEYNPDPVSKAPSGLQLYEHQLRTVSFIRQKTVEDQGCIVAARAGLGKTLSSIHSCWLDGLLQRPGLVLGPLGAQGTWCGPGSDPLVHYGLDIKPLTGTDPDFRQVSVESGWYFIHYDIIKSWTSLIFGRMKPSCLIADESHALCNPGSDRSASVQLVSSWSRILRRILLTGTPVPKTALDLWQQLAIAQPGQWGNAIYPYGIRYCGGRRLSFESGKSHFIFDGKTNREELRARLAGIFLKYDESSAPGTIPALERHRIDFELSPEARKEYYKARKDIRKYVDEKKGTQPEKIEICGMEYKLDSDRPKALQLVATSIFKSIIDADKARHAPETINELMQKHNKLVVFTWQVNSAKAIYKELIESDIDYALIGPIDGTTPWPQRRKLAAEFSSAPGRAVFIATRGSCGISINDLRFSDAMLQVTPDWNPDGNIQAEGRGCRQGNPNPVFHSYFMLTRGTLDDRVLELLRLKSEEAKSISTHDEQGLHLVAELDPDFIEEDSISLDDILSIADEVRDI